MNEFCGKCGTKLIKIRVGTIIAGRCPKCFPEIRQGVKK